jgi:enoyl-CoA hydratase
MPAAKKMAASIAANAPIAVRACKKAINEGLQVSIDEGVAIEEELFGSCFESYDQVEGMANFLRKKDDPKKVKKVAFRNE